MNKKLIPTYHSKSIFEVNITKLLEMQKKVIFLDLDNTLANPYMELPEDKIINIIKEMKYNKLKVILLSNNHEPRVKKFANPLQVDYIFEVKKPKTQKLENYLKEHHILKKECLSVGDQVMTDVLCANRLGIEVILVDPLTKQDEPITFIPRLLDKHFRKVLAKKNLLKEF